MKVGFIGLGSMGLPMAERLQNAGHELTVYARRAASLEPLRGTNATIAATPAAMGTAVDAVGICVFDAAGVEEVMFGPAGLAETLRPGTVILVHSTVSPTQIRSIAERATTHQLRVLDAPVSGGAPRAQTGELTIMIGGDTAALTDVNDLLSALSNHVVHLGAIGAGSHAKLINNTLFAAQITLTDDAMKAGTALGVDPAGLAAVLMTSSSACIASGLRLRAGSTATVAASPAGPPLVKDVHLMTQLLGNAPGRELIDVAHRFTTAAHP
ncbi:NAD(P)-dependent oxidoreductase [Frankia sp. CNm7]|uniref:NAD(P)-dependent oxidoreductase n=1 Tax=Frankia nepalensis TaxID=1836974 RepID=A0A937RI45_9ACTN|nr:NAD(P)-dependent oxidoreductase [Frankia nepalensis]MBL7499669.1 NAD(P)-dependent oxidoreductase [Frankia nepalensis]MBL7514641.1 NAD(P)-dependent oxidoreductase [Frankia nepalensis]MBL7522612.1 NAD(P)-dependent oxidoreductase [Frankia nepalensis]MBL7629395.1 NAD(P)-dependent oxidoreductase [Frankia nepalensis]